VILANLQQLELFLEMADMIVAKESFQTVSMKSERLMTCHFLFLRETFMVFWAKTAQVNLRPFECFLLLSPQPAVE
jgi:hypothetical protein